MKKIIFCLLVTFALLLGVAACSSGADSEFTKDEFGNQVLSSDRGNTTFVEDIPYASKYNNTSVSLTEFGAYQNISNYSYNLFILITLDVSNLSDEELHWLRESDLEVNSYITSEDNGYDFDSMPELGNLLLTDSKELVFVFTTSFFKENRYDFSESKVCVAVSAKQEETYEYENSEGKVSDLHKSEALQYTISLDADLSSPETIEQPLYEYIVKWLNNKANQLG